MFFIIILCSLLTQLTAKENAKVMKPYVVVQVPVEMPNRNDRSDQCWLRVEDVEVTSMITIYCYIAHDFLKTYTYEYNKRKMEEENFNDSEWNEEPIVADNCILSKPNYFEKDYKTTTLSDTITRNRIYVSVSADCKLVMYSREGTTNYNVDCPKLLYYINCRTSSSASSLNINLVLAGVILWLMS